jgi:hypothetical protein
MPLQSALTQKCTRCGVVKDLSEYWPCVKDSKKGKKGELGDKCGKCMDDDAKFKSRKRKYSNIKEGFDEEEARIEPASGNTGSAQGPVMSLPQFLQRVAEAADVDNGGFELSERVDCSSATSKDSDALTKAHDVARVMEKATLWRWT